MGYTFQASQYMNGYHFYIKSISMGYLFHPKSIWMGKIWKIVYEWGQFSKIVYEWGRFSIWEVYEWVMFFTWPGIWMGWGSGTPAAHPYPKSWQVTPPPWANLLYGCTPTNKDVWSLWWALLKPPQRRQGPDPRPLWLLVVTPYASGPARAFRLRVAVRMSIDIFDTLFV